MLLRRRLDEVWHHGHRVEFLISLLSSGFLLFAFADGPRGAALALRVLVVLLCAAAHVGVPLVANGPQRLRTAWFVLDVAVFLLLLPALGLDVLWFGMFPVVAAAVLLPLCPALLVGVIAAPAMLARGWQAQDSGLVVLGMVAAIVGTSMAFGIERERKDEALREAHQRNAVLAVAAERARIGRDLHDLLGHSLTAVAVKTELARKLVTLDPAAAEAQLAEVELVARQALADVRATTRGMQQVRLAGELASARSVLEASGISCVSPSALPLLDDASSELFGWALREAVTNVVRHSGARRCTVEVSAGSIRISDDGHGFSSPGSGSGLKGLAARARAAGAVLQTRSSGSGTMLAVELAAGTPAAGNEARA